MEDGEWVLVRKPAEKDFWNPTSMNFAETSKPLKVTFSGPANHWTDAIPIGNGRLGAMVWGGIASETLQLNEDTLWTGIPGNYTNPNAPAALSEVRKLVDDGDYAEATKAAVKLSDNPSDVYQLLGDIKLEFDDSHIKYTEGTYRRELDLESATARVKYSVGDVEFTREHFVSSPDQVIVTKISGSKPGFLSFTVSLDSKLDHHSQANGQNQIIMQGSCPGKRRAPKGSAEENPKGIQFAAVLDLQISQGGVVHSLDDKRLKVEGSDWAVLLLVASSSFDGPFTMPSDSRKDPTAESLNALKSIKTLSYSDLYAHHLDDYENLFHRVSLQLSKSSKGNLRDGSLEIEKVKSSTKNSYFSKNEDDAVSTAERVKSFQTDEDPSFVELLFQYGRYLLISSSRPGTQVSNLQGIWNKDIEPAWDCAPHLNINLQMNYWPSLSCNLKECQEPLFDYISSLSINGSKTAKVNYEASGWVAHQVSDLWAKTSPDRGEAVWALWPMGGAWLCTHLWEHYTHTMDKVLGRKNDALIGKVLEAQTKLPPTKIARDGSIMEWAQDFEDPDVHHRHVSHLFGLFPGHTITVEKTQDLCKAADYTLFKRGEDGPGCSTTWKIALWARLHNSEHAYRMVKHLISLVDPTHEGDFEGGLYSNLFTAHPPFQIDANFGFSAAVAEMLVQSTMKDLYLLPALPRDKWTNGCAKGLKARGGVTVNICWQEGDLEEVGLWSNEQNSVRKLHYRGTTITAKISSGKVYTFNRQLKCVKTYSLTEAAFS
ncbi:alpha-L-fucosidase 2-like isoform X2 [Durio zibethinus]|uniref:Alpha-L-fucosidase 2-like isoform X2 n=1 Tax=Durio zibethinus TaxID=66656 RepID=A0A6P6AF73_DURZI|nr:alpha-L-fucosidase 2-like isoform X2 [Durio zibethinus]